MVKYVLTAAALKAFSATPFSRRIYRGLGNSMGGRKRSRGRAPDYYFERVNILLAAARDRHIVRDGDTIAELGTGWLHWGAISVRLFFDVKSILFDVWDNRQFDGFQNYVGQLENHLDELDAATEEQRGRARELIREIRQTRCFDDVYSLLDFHYVLEPSGRPDLLGADRFDLVLSDGVLEHIHECELDSFVRGVATIVKPGGHCMHSINLRDHLYAYDRSVSPKQFLSYPTEKWKRWFENEVQYINRAPRSRWLSLFQDAGLELVEESTQIDDVQGLSVASEYAAYESSDLTCRSLRILHRKP